MSDLIKRLRETYPATYAFTDIPHIGYEAADALTAANDRIRELEVENNSCGLLLLRAEGQLTTERTALVQERLVSDKLEKALEDMVRDKTEGPFFHEDEHLPGSSLHNARAALAEVSRLRNANPAIRKQT